MRKYYFIACGLSCGECLQISVESLSWRKEPNILVKHQLVAARVKVQDTAACKHMLVSITADRKLSASHMRGGCQVVCHPKPWEGEHGSGAGKHRGSIHASRKLQSWPGKIRYVRLPTTELESWQPCLPTPILRPPHLPGSDGCDVAEVLPSNELL